MAAIKKEADDPSMFIRPDKRPPIPTKKIVSDEQINRQDKDKRGVEKENEETPLTDKPPRLLGTGNVSTGKRAAEKENKETPSNAKRPCLMECDNVSSASTAGCEQRVETKQPLTMPKSLELCSISPHKAPKRVLLRRVTTEVVVRPLPAAVVTPPTPPAIDNKVIKAIAVGFCQYLKENPEKLRELLPATPKRSVKQEPPEVITLDDDTPAVEEAPQSSDAELAALMKTLDEGQKKRLIDYLLKPQSEGNKPVTVSPAEPVAETLQQLLQNAMEPEEESGRSAEDEMHVTFWNGQTKSKICPICKRTVGISGRAKSEHYIKYHYDVYYPLIGQKTPVERWVGARFGTGSQKEKTEKLRVCLHCKTENYYRGRIELIRHLRKVHPTLLAQMKKEYAVVSRKQQIKDEEVHRRMVDERVWETKRRLPEWCTLVILMVHVSTRSSGSHR